MVDAQFEEPGQADAFAGVGPGLTAVEKFDSGGVEGDAGLAGAGDGAEVEVQVRIARHGGRIGPGAAVWGEAEEGGGEAGASTARA